MRKSREPGTQIAKKHTAAMQKLISASGHAAKNFRQKPATPNVKQGVGLFGGFWGFLEWWAQGFGLGFSGGNVGSPDSYKCWLRLAKTAMASEPNKPH